MASAIAPDVLPEFTGRWSRPHLSAKARRAAARRAGIAACRLPIVAPFVMMAPEVVSGLRGRPEAVAHLSSSGPDVFGNAAFICFVLMVLVTPVATVTGWRRHVPLRRTYGLGMFAIALTDLVTAAIVTGNRFPGGFMTRVTGHTFLAVGTLATLLCVPLALTANHRAQRALGKYWKQVHRITYVVWLAIVVHLLLLFGFHGPAVAAIEVSAPLAALRLPQLRRWYAASRRAQTHRLARSATVVVAMALVGYGLEPFVHNLVVSGVQAFVQRPVD
ncbi:MAG TPA: ferric reductase-like transmembrane domain-containing protein [Mycobacteriales bacterium]|nr:ferric reductase-like transmembrane domain-containing protein [Mycobacteriales bacterium]